VLGGKIHVFGGEADEGTFNENEAYDPATDTWRAMAPMPTARHGLGAAVVDGSIYVMSGGTEPGGSTSGANEVFSP
jgi:N-acetylneuraminic acid mutarotase